MRRIILLSFIIIVSFSVSAFAAGAGKPGKAQEAHGPKDAKPGSHEDWCGEHGVPESQDTRCDPTLIPAFKATGDWCKDHGLPKSQCKKCNPKLKIVRPPKGTK